jgi:hypothetical protein
VNRMKANILGLLAASIAVGAFAIAPTIGSAEEGPVEEVPAQVEGTEEVELFAETGCEANHVCGYEAINFEGSRVQVPCSQNSDWYPGFTIRSARNRCGNKINWLGNFAVCMNPGGDRPNPGSFAFLRLPAGWAPPYC